MATIEQLSTALKNAHTAGDAGAAQKLAAAIKQMQASGNGAPSEVAEGKIDPMSDEGIGRNLEFATWATPMSTASRAYNAAKPPIRKKVAPPTSGQLRSVGGKQMERAKNMGVDFAPQEVANWGATVSSNLERKIHPKRAPETFDLLSEFGKVPNHPAAVAEFGSIVAARQGFKDIAQGAKGQEKLAATLVIKEIDKFLESPPANSVVSGNAARAASINKSGMDNYAAGSRSKSINARGGSAELKAQMANSGGNTANKVRTAAGWYIDPLHPERLSGFTPEEAALLKNVAAEGAGRKAARNTGNALGGGMGIGALIGGMAGGAGAGSFLGPVGTAVGAVGVPITARMLKIADDIMTKRALRRADMAVRSRSPLAQSRAQNAPYSPIQPEARAAIRSAVSRAAIAPQMYRPGPMEMTVTKPLGSPEEPQ